MGQLGASGVIGGLSLEVASWGGGSAGVCGIVESLGHLERVLVFWIAAYGMEG